jgi:succinoglycan biosynthesis transport protein ExoP
VELRDYIRVIRKRWLLIALSAMAGLAIGATASILITPQYEARTLSFVSVQNAGTMQEFNQGALYTQSMIKSFTEAISSPAVLSKVVDDPQLGLTETVADLASDITAKVAPNTVNIEIAVTRENPVEAANIANAVTASFRAEASMLTRPRADEQSPVAVTILTPAQVPTAPVVPRTKLYLAASLLVGLAVGVVAAVLIDALDTRIRGRQHVRGITDAPILGGVAFDESAQTRPLIVQSAPTDPRAEAFRSLRTNLQFLDVEGGPRSFVITSASVAEGKSTTTANLAIVIAQSDVRVLVIDADLRHPNVAPIFGLEGAVGLTDVLIGKVELPDAVQNWGLRNLDILPAGRIPPNPSELLGSEAMMKLLQLVEKEYDVVLVDTPPLLPVTDAAVLSKHVRGALLVVASGRTHKAQLQSAIDALNNVDARIAGIVLTMMPTKGAEAYGYARYGYRSYGLATRETNGSPLDPSQFLNMSKTVTNTRGS